MTKNNFINLIKSKKTIIPYLLNTDFNISNSEYSLKSSIITFHSKSIIEIIPNSFKESTDALVISAGIHGNETAPIEITSHLLLEILEEEIICKQPLLILFGNIESMKSEQRFLDFNLNRLFNKEYLNHQDCLEAQRAKELEEIVTYFREKFSHLHLLHLDLHTAIRESYHQKFAISPVTNKKHESFENLLKAMDIEAYIEAKTPSNTFSDFSSRFDNATSFTVELGKVKPFGENDLTQFSKATLALRSLIGLERIEKVESDLIRYRTFSEITKETQNFEFLINENDKNFSHIAKDTKIFKDDEKIYQYERDLYLVFANSNVVLGQRAGILLERTTKEK